jgi:hypothetical protein
MSHRTPLSLVIAASFAATSHGQSVTWEFLARQSADADVAGVPTAVWVPGAFNNGCIDDEGRVIVANTIQNADATLTNANQRVVMRGTPSGLNLIARNGSPALAGAPAGAVFNQLIAGAGVNGITTTFSTSASGYMVVGGMLNGGSVVHTAGPTQNNSAMWLVGSDGAASLMGIVGMQAPGASAGTYLTTNFSSSNLSTSTSRVTNEGKFLWYSSTAGGDTVTSGAGANNNGFFLLTTSGPSSAQLVFRRGQPAPALTDGTYLSALSSFSGIINANSVLCTATLAGGSTTTANDAAVLLSISGSPRIAVREGDPVFGLTGLTFTGTISVNGRGLGADGRFVFTSTIAGAGVTTADDLVFCLYDPNGGSRVLLREGDASAAWGGGTLSNINSTGLAITSTNHVIFNAGLLVGGAAQNAMVDYDLGTSAINVILRGGEQAAGLASGVQYATNYAGSSSPMINAKGEMVVAMPLQGAVTSGTDDRALYAWSASTGLRMVLQLGQTGLTGYALKSFSPIGNAGQNGNGGSTGLSETGWFVTNGSDANPDSATGTDYFVIRARVFGAANPCPADFNDDNNVGGDDLAVLLGSWGVCGTGSCVADIDLDGQVDGFDLSIVLGAWGACP